jgi:hypothetical protein
LRDHGRLAHHRSLLLGSDSGLNGRWLRHLNNTLDCPFNRRWGASTVAPAVRRRGAITAGSVPAAGSLRTPSAASDVAEGAGDPTSLP